MILFKVFLDFDVASFLFYFNSTAESKLCQKRSTSHSGK